MRGHAELRGDGVGARANGIADGDQTGPVDMIAAQQVGVALGDAPASEQAKSDHETSLLAAIIDGAKFKAMDAQGPI